MDDTIGAAVLVLLLIPMGFFLGNIAKDDDSWQKWRREAWLKQEEEIRKAKAMGMSLEGWREQQARRLGREEEEE